METEYEATFVEVDAAAVRLSLTRAGAVCEKPEFVQKRSVYHLPRGNEITGGWLRVRDEGDRTTLSLKVVNGTTMVDQKELCVVVDSFAHACALLEAIGCCKKAYQETKRELWMLGSVEVMIDTWPFLPTFVEIEGSDETTVRTAAQILGFSWDTARFCHVGTLYAEKYGFPEEVFNDRTPILTFDMPCPFQDTPYGLLDTDTTSDMSKK